MQALSNGVLRRANLDFAASPLHLGRGLSPYDKPKTSPQKNAGTFEWCTPPC